MIYQTELVVPPQTVVYEPFEGRLAVNVGIVTQVWVRWRWGAGNLCGAQIYREGFQVWPSTMGVWFPSSQYDLTWEESYQVPDYPLEFIIRAYNEDDTFPHRLYVAVNLQRPDINQNVRDFMAFIANGGNNG